MEWLKELQERHTSGYAHKGICVSCKRGESACLGGRFKNVCPNYVDPTPTKGEHLEKYAALIRKMFEAEGEPARIELYGAAQSRRKFLCGYLNINEDLIRAVEDSVYQDNWLNERDLRRLRWEL